MQVVGWILWGFGFLWVTVLTLQFLKGAPETFGNSYAIRAVLLPWIVLVALSVAETGQVHVTWMIPLALVLPSLLDAVATRTLVSWFPLSYNILLFGAIGANVGYWSEDWADQLGVTLLTFHASVLGAGCLATLLAVRRAKANLADLDESAVDRVFGTDGDAEVSSGDP